LVPSKRGIENVYIKESNNLDPTPVIRQLQPPIMVVSRSSEFNQQTAIMYMVGYSAEKKLCRGAITELRKRLGDTFQEQCDALLTVVFDKKSHVLRHEAQEAARWLTGDFNESRDEHSRVTSLHVLEVQVHRATSMTQHTSRSRHNKPVCRKPTRWQLARTLQGAR